jgi:general secretion pathway protein J
MSKNSSDGFTLLEMLLVVVIFTMMSLFIYQTLIVVTQGSTAVNKKAKLINKLHKAINMLEHDISHAIIYPHSLKNNKLKDCFSIGNRLLESDDFGFYLICNNNINDEFPFNYQSKNFGYRLKNKKIEKIFNITSGGVNKQEPGIYKILDDVIAFRMRIYHEGKWLTEWSSEDLLPHGIEVTIELENTGTVRRVILLLNK